MEGPEKKTLPPPPPPPKFSAARSPYPPTRQGKFPIWDSEESDASSTGRHVINPSPFEDTNESSESTQPSCSPSTRSSLYQTSSNTTPALPQDRPQRLSRDHFRPSAPPDRQINAPDSSLTPPGPSGPSSRRSSARVDGSPSPQVAPVDEIAPVPPVHPLPPSHLAETTNAAPENAAKPETATRSQAEAEAELKKARRKITFQKYLATAGLIGLKCVFPPLPVNRYRFCPPSVC